MRFKAILVTAVMAISLSACVVAPPPRHRTLVEVAVRPPAPKVVAVPAPRRGYIWAPGYWRWNGRAHVWIAGGWIRARPNKRWIPAHWEEFRPDRWRFEEGHWERK